MLTEILSLDESPCSQQLSLFVFIPWGGQLCSKGLSSFAADL